MQSQSRHVAGLCALGAFWKRSQRAEEVAEHLLTLLPAAPRVRQTLMIRHIRIRNTKTKLSPLSRNRNNTNFSMVSFNQHGRNIKPKSESLAIFIFKLGVPFKNPRSLVIRNADSVIRHGNLELI